MTDRCPTTPIDAGDGVLLRRLRRSDVAGVFAVHSDASVYEFDPDETHLDLAQSQQFMAPLLAHWAEFGFGYWAVLVPPSLLPDGVPGGEPEDAGRHFAGLAGIRHYRIDGVDHLNVYYRFAPAAQGQGLVQRVLTNAIALAPHVAPGADLVVRTRPGNAVARRVAERAGFVDEGLEPGDTDLQLLRYAMGVRTP